MNRRKLPLILFASALLSVNILSAEDNSTNTINPNIQRVFQVYTPGWDYDLNPQTAQYASEAQILNSLYEGLFCYNPMTSEAIGAYCKSYKLSRDKKRWTFTIREGAVFSNGDPITAETFKESWLNLLANPDAEFASFADCIQGAKAFRSGNGKREDVRISAPDSSTLVVHLTEPSEHLPQILCHHSFAAISTKENVYSGPFILESYKDNTIVLTKNENYIDKDKVHIPGVTITMIDNADELSHKFNTGQADWVMKNANYDKIIDKDAIQIFAQFGTQYYFFKMNSEIWSKKEFRRALIEAIPYNKLRDGFYLPASTLVYPLSGYPTVIGYNDYDTEDAIIMMNQARKKYNIPQDLKLPLVIAVSSESLWEMQSAIILKNAWKPLGVEVSIQSTQNSRYIASIPNWKADIFHYGWIGDYADPLAFLELFRTGSSLNTGLYSNPEYDKLLEKAASAETVQEHYRYQARAEQILLDEGEVIPLAYFISSNVLDANLIGGWYKNSMDIHPFKYIYFQDKKSRIPNFVRYQEDQE